MVKVVRIRQKFNGFPWAYVVKSGDVDLVRFGFPNRIEFYFDWESFCTVSVFNSHFDVEVTRKILLELFGMETKSHDFFYETSKLMEKMNEVFTGIFFMVPLTMAGGYLPSRHHAITKNCDISYFVRGERTEEKCASCEQVFKCMAKDVKILQKDCVLSHSISGGDIMTETLKKRYVGQGSITNVVG